jgi:hypothetical protein
MNPLVKLLHIVQWIAVFFLFFFPLFLVKLVLLVHPFFDMSWLQAFLPVGLVFLGAFLVVPLALLFKADMKKLPIWGNREEGYPDWFDRYVQAYWYKKIFPRWWWFCIRNSTNNFRYLFDDTKPFKTIGWQDDVMEAHTLIAAGVKSASRWRYRGLLAGYRKVWLNDDGETYGELWVGWKVGSKVPGLGFTTQLRRKATIGQ